MVLAQSAQLLAPARTIPDHPPGPPDELRTIVEVLRWRAERTPDVRVFTFLDGDHEIATLTYSELDERARAIAAELQKRGALGERVLLLSMPGLDFVTSCYGCLYAGAMPVPAYPPDPLRLQRTIPRLQAIVRDAGAKFVLGSTETIQLVPQGLGNAPRHTLSLPQLERGRADDWEPYEADERDVALLQYTSGSTGDPRGVMVMHGNILHCLGTMHHEDTPDVVGMTWLPPYHDMGLLGGVFVPVYSGRPIIVMSPVAFLERPVRWLQAISRYRVKTSIGPNFSYDLCVRKTRPQDCADLDLSCWTIAVVGAEPVRPATLDRFVDMFAPHGFRREAFMPAYGLAEAVLNVTAGHYWEPPIVSTFAAAALEEHRAEPAARDDAGARTLVACGKAWPGHRVLVVDPQTCRPVEAGRVGEVWIQSPSVTAGYWNRPEETERLFHARLANGDGPFLRSGDLGFFHDGELYITGRLKDVIILGGRNFYPQDIEQVVAASHPSLRQDTGAAFACEIDGEERLIVVQEARRSDRYALDEVIAAIRREVAAEIGVAPYAVVLIAGGTAPKTSSGKIQRRACRDLFRKGELKVLAEWRAAAVLNDLITLLRSYHDSQYSGPMDDRTMMFADLGMGSIDAVMFAEKIEEHFGKDFPFNEFLAELRTRGLNDISVGDLARFLRRYLSG